MLRTNVLQGEVQRSWVWLSPAGAKHVIDLWHDTVTGVRSVAVGLEEVPGSMGSSPFFTTEPHHINFTVGHEQARGMVIIEKAGLFSFRYTCVVNGRPLRATLQELADENEERFNVAILATANAYSTKEKAVTWYELTVTRRSDGARTVVHRRYREFQCLFEQVHAAFKGHHLRSSLPELPGRQLKLLVDHTDTAFVEERRLLLETAVGKLLSVPHVCAMVPVQVFLGFFDRLKEHSVVFTQRDLGMSITRTVVPEESIIVTRVKEVGHGGQQTRVMVGDTVSKVNGEPVSKYGGFDGVAFQISKGLRPIVIHFLEAVEKNPDHDFLPPGDLIEIPPVQEQLRQRQASLPPSFPSYSSSSSSSPHHSVIPTPSGLPTRVASPTVPMEATPQPTAAAAPSLPPARRKATSNPPPPPSVPRADARPPGRGPPPRQRPIPPPSSSSSSSSSSSNKDDGIDRLSSKRQEEDPKKLQNILEAALVEEERRGTEGGRGLGASSSASLMEQKDPLMDLSTSGGSSSSSSSNSNSSSSRVVVTTAGIVGAGAAAAAAGGGEAVLTPPLVVATPPPATAARVSVPVVEKVKKVVVVSPPDVAASVVVVPKKKKEEKKEKEEEVVTPPPPAPVAPEQKEEEKEAAPQEMPAKKKKEEEEQAAVVAAPVPVAMPSPPVASSDPPLPIPQAPSAHAPTIRSLSPPLPSIFPSSSLPAPLPTPAVKKEEKREEAAPTPSSSLPPSTPPVEAAEVAPATEKTPNSNSSSSNNTTNGSSSSTTTTTTTQKKEGVGSVVADVSPTPPPPRPPSPPPPPHPHNHLHPHHPQHNHRRLTPPRIKKAGTEGQEDEGGKGGEGEGGEVPPPSPFEDYM